MTKPLPSRRCVICAAALPEGARYCTSCEKYQGWLTRFLGGLNVQALVTLVPVATLAFVFVKDQLDFHGSDVRITLSCKRGPIRLAVSNTGDRPAIIEEIRVGITSGSAGPTKTYPAQLQKIGDNHDEQLMLPAQALEFYDLIVLNEQGQQFPLRAPDGGASECTYQLTAEIIAFDHVPDLEIASCTCPAR